MSSPSQLGSIGNRVSLVLPLSTSTARFFVRTSDTGTIVSTSRAVDLSRALHVGATGGKPLDATVHARRSGPPVWKSVACAIPLEMVFHTSGVSTFVTVAHKTRAATSGAGSTWRTLKTDVYRYKMGTDTDATFHNGLISDCNLQAVDRYYKTNITTAWRTATSTSAKDTTTNQEMVINSPVWIFSGADSPNVTVPYKVS
jgi:hypothetical protein